MEFVHFHISSKYNINLSLVNKFSSKKCGGFGFNLNNGNPGIGTTSPGYQLDVWDTAVRGNGAYVNRASHSSLKGGFTDAFVLGKISQLNLKEWQYKQPEVCGGDDSRHLSPFADDFYGVFGLGDGPRQIRSSDVAGVALKGVQELILHIQQLNDKIKALEAKIGQIEG